MQRTKKTMIPLILLYSLVGCASMGPKPHVVYHRPDINTNDKKVIIFPVSDFNGEFSEGAKDIEIAVNTHWTNLYGPTNVIPAGKAVEKLVSSVHKKAYVRIVQTLDSVSMIEQLQKDKNFKGFLAKVAETVGDYNLALTIVKGDQKSYDSKQPIQINVGYFDTKKLTWKWITKVSTQKGIVGDWRGAYGMMLSNSFDFVKEKELNKVVQSP